MAHRPNLSDEKAVRILPGLRDGKTPRLLGITEDRLKAYCAAHPEYGREALPLLEANVKAAFLRKGAHLRDRPTCKYGHSLEGARTYMKDGYKFRFCVECRKVDDAKGGNPAARADERKDVAQDLETRAPSARSSLQAKEGLRD